MQRIHRRKNQDIPKDYVCAEGCGKAYGSYAALYTHMKNKHGCLKVMDVKPAPAKIKASGRKGRPLIKAKQQVVVADPVISENVCKICYQEQCICDSSINSEEVSKTIDIMSDRTYLRLLNCIGNLNVGQAFTWIRSTEDDYQITNKERLKQMVEQFNMRNNLISEVHLSDRWLQYLFQLSKYLDRRYLNEFFQGIFSIISKRIAIETGIFKSGGQELPNFKKCFEERKKQWKEFVETVLMI